MADTHLIWDFDGVFNALSGQSLSGYRTVGDVMFNQDIINAVNSFMARTCEQVVPHWLTTREADVHELAASIGLNASSWDLIALDDGWDELDIKRSTLLRHIATTEVSTILWVDDTLGALGRDFIPSHVETVLVAPDARTGLSLDDLDALDAFTTIFCGDMKLVF